MKNLLKYYQKLNTLIIPTLMLVGTSIFYAVLSFAHPWIYKIVFDNLIPTYDKDLLLQIIMCLFSICILNIMSNVLMETLGNYIKIETIIRIRTEVTEKLLSYPYAYFQKNQPGEIVQRIIPEIDAIGNLIAESVKVISYLIQIVVMLFLIATVNINMFIIGLTVLILYSAWFHFFKQSLTIYDKRLKIYGSDLYTFFAELIENVKNVKLFNLYNIKSRELNKRLAAIENDSLKNCVVHTFFHYGNTIFTIALFIITAFCFHEILKEHMTIGYYLVFTAMMGILVGPINILLGFGGQFQTGIVSVNRLDTIISIDFERSGNRKFEKFCSEIILDGINFSYGEADVLKNINIKIQKGQNVAIVGGSGSGKTTLAHLLVRLYEPVKGKIVLDGTALSSFDLLSLRDKIGLLSQDVFLFNNSIKENINPEGTRSNQAMETALKKAQMANFIDKLDYDVGENGQKLSGGERQRLSIARLLTRNCEIIILDEATSNLDPKTTKELLTTFKTIQVENPHITFITITHNIQNLLLMDTIFVLENGSIVNQGSYNELASNCRVFKELFNIL